MSNTGHVEFLAKQLLPRFIPKDDKVKTLTFQFTVAPDTTYRVNFAKRITAGKIVWELLDYEELAKG